MPKSPESKEEGAVHSLGDDNWFNVIWKGSRDWFWSHLHHLHIALAECQSWKVKGHLIKNENLCISAEVGGSLCTGVKVKFWIGQSQRACLLNLHGLSLGKLAYSIFAKKLTTLTNPHDEDITCTK